MENKNGCSIYKIHYYTFISNRYSPDHSKFDIKIDRTLRQTEKDNFKLALAETYKKIFQKNYGILPNNIIDCFTKDTSKNQIESICNELTPIDLINIPNNHLFTNSNFYNINNQIVPYISSYNYRFRDISNDMFILKSYKKNNRTAYTNTK